MSSFLSISRPDRFTRTIGSRRSCNLFVRRVLLLFRSRCSYRSGRRRLPSLTLIESEVHLANSAVERLALDLCQLKLLRCRLSAAVTSSECACTPRRATADLGHIALKWERMCVTKRNVDHSLMGPRRESGNGGRLLSTTLSRGAHEETKVLARQGTLGPETTELVDEGLPLCRVVAVT